MKCTFQVCAWKETYENRWNPNNWIITTKFSLHLKWSTLLYHSKVDLDSRRNQTTMMDLDIFTPKGETLHILGDEENKSCKKSWVLSLFKCIGILVGQQTSSTAAVASLDFADNGLSGEKKKQASLDFFLELTITRQLVLKFCQLSTELIVNRSHWLWRWANTQNVSFKPFTVANLRYQLS